MFYKTKEEEEDYLVLNNVPVIFLDPLRFLAYSCRRSLDISNSQVREKKRITPEFQRNINIQLIFI